MAYLRVQYDYRSSRVQYDSTSRVVLFDIVKVLFLNWQFASNSLNRFKLMSVWRLIEFDP